MMAIAPAHEAPEHKAPHRLLHCTPQSSIHHRIPVRILVVTLEIFMLNVKNSTKSSRQNLLKTQEMINMIVHFGCKDFE
jgi:hypothetical protein